MANMPPLMMKSAMPVSPHPNLPLQAGEGANVRYASFTLTGGLQVLQPGLIKRQITRRVAAENHLAQGAGRAHKIAHRSNRHFDRLFRRILASSLFLIGSTYSRAHRGGRSRRFIRMRPDIGLGTRPRLTQEAWRAETLSLKMAFVDRSSVRHLSSATTFASGNQ